MRKIDLNKFQTATNETAREINSRIMLNLVRKHQPVSRADLMRYSGLQRSTISVITERLIAERWLREGAVGNLPRGRKPTFLHLNTERCCVVGVDIQPDVTRFALANLDNEFLAQDSMPTEKDSQRFVARLSRRIMSLVRSHPHKSYGGAGITLPGRVDSSQRQLISSSALGWNKVDLKSMLEHSLGSPVELENTANACALAELWSGRHPVDVHNIVAVTISDEIGAGMILNGQLARGSMGTAGEFGHVMQMPEGPICQCGNRGCWQALASNTAAVRYYTESALNAKGEAGPQNLSKLSFGDIIRLAERNDVSARKALARMAHYLGAGIAMLVTGLAPEIVVVNGEITRAWNKLEPIVVAAVKSRSFSHAMTRIAAAKPESQLPLHGAVTLILQKHFNFPSIGQ